MLVPLLATQRGGLNMYAYALNNPIRYVDPMGQSVVVKAGLGIVVAILFVAGAVIYLSTIDNPDFAGAMRAGRDSVVEAWNNISNWWSSRGSSNVSVPSTSGQAASSGSTTWSNTGTVPWGNVVAMGSKQGLSDIGPVTGKQLRDMSVEELLLERQEAIRRGDTKFVRKIDAQLKFSDKRNVGNQRRLSNKRPGGRHRSMWFLPRYSEYA